MTYQTDAAKKAHKKEATRAEALVIAAYGRLAGSVDLDAVLDEKLAGYPEERARLRAYIQRLIPHLRDH